ncbi:MAG: DUF3017 domain-containing protein [Streptosporangiaceae bacterium]
MKHSAKAAARQAREAAGRGLVNQLPYWIVLAGIGLGLATMRGTVQSVKGGTLVIAGALLAGAVARAVLPEGRAGLLGSRRRPVDVAALTALGVGLLIAGLVLKVPG